VIKAFLQLFTLKIYVGPCSKPTATAANVKGRNELQKIGRVTCFDENRSALWGEHTRSWHARVGGELKCLKEEQQARDGWWAGLRADVETTVKGVGGVRGSNGWRRGEQDHRRRTFVPTTELSAGEVEMTDESESPQ